MKTNEFRGIIPPLITPLSPDGDVDVPSLRRLSRYVVDGGVDALWVLGATGQFHTLTERQRDLVTDTVIQEVSRKVPVLIGCIDTSPDRCIERAKRAKASGADGIFATAPIYDKVTQVEVLAHFRRIHEAVDLPMVAYDASYATQTPMEISTVVELAEEATLVGIKDSADFADFPHLVAQLRHLPAFSVLTGHTCLADAAYLIGAAGCVPTLGNLIPSTYAKIQASAKQGDWAAARKSQDEAVSLHNVQRCWEPASISIVAKSLGLCKTVLKLLGVIDCSNPGNPYPSPTPEQEERVRSELERLGILKSESVLSSPSGR
ncbi:MAG: dihydrodipicolinate synthase family protein [Terracidiphilus sp.]